MSRVFKVFLVCEEIDKDGQVLVLEDRYYFKEYKIPDGILFLYIYRITLSEKRSCGGENFYLRDRSAGLC